jgi:pyruvate,water dikinase
MTTTTANQGPELRIPRPGSWERDATHSPRPLTRFFQETQPEPFIRGFSDAMRRYGILLHHLEYEFPQGFAYNTKIPVADEDVPERFAAAAQAFEQKLWREDLRRWDEQVKPNSIAIQRALQSEDPDSMSDEELLDYLERCRQNVQDRIYDHHQFNSAALITVGDFMVHGARWTGLGMSELLELMRGSTRVSAGESAERDALIAALRESEEARALLDSGRDAGEVLGELQRLPEPVGLAAREYVELVGHRTADGFDIAEPVVLEKPELLLASLRHDFAADVAGEAELGPATERVRSLVPEGEREHFDELLAEARLTYRLRDERGIYNDIWAWGLMRRAVLAAGGRLAARGRLDNPEQLLYAGYEEMRALLGSGDDPSAAELAERAQRHAANASVETPAYLGDPPQPPPPLDGLPEPAARAMAAIGTAIGALFENSDAPNEERLVRGIPASPGVYEGTARVIAGPDELDRITQGDVLVTASTSEAFNLALPLLGAIVTNSGGLLSHAAIVAREYGIPSVVGTREATTIVPDGARVRVDAGAGEVAVIGP